MKIHFGIFPHFNQIESLSLLKSSCISILASILAVGGVVSSAKAATENSEVPKYDHIFEIVMENHASKHNPFLNFAHVQDTPEEFQNIVPDTQLAEDLRSGQVPNFGMIVPDICYDMHGNKQDCPKSITPGDDNDRSLVRNGDAYVGNIVDQITTSDIWSRGNNAIVITWDEDNKTDNNHIPTIVITNNGPRGIQDNTLYSHYSLLQTVQKAFGLGCSQNTCDTENVKSMTPLFALPTPSASTAKRSYVWKWHWFDENVEEQRKITPKKIGMSGSPEV